LVKSADEFHRRGRGLQAWCKPCRRAYDAAYHRRTRTRRIEQKKRHHALLTEWMREMKAGRPCAECGGLFPVVAMQWDHRPGEEKVGDVSDLIRKTHSKKRILVEIAKCDLVCANCHAVRTFKSRGVAQPG